MRRAPSHARAYVSVDGPELTFVFPDLGHIGREGRGAHVPLREMPLDERLQLTERYRGEWGILREREGRREDGGGSEEERRKGGEG